MRVHIIPILRDNYAYVIGCPASQQAMVIDPGESLPILALLTAQKYTLTHIFLTHHHWDHTQGIADLMHADVQVLGGADDAKHILSLTHPLQDQESFDFAGYSFTALHVPGHTKGALALYSSVLANVFTGDTLFTAGCGRALECDLSTLYQSLLRLRALPQETLIYDGHSYTQNNLRFARSILPADLAVMARSKHVETLIAAQKPMVPESLAVECASNLFLRCEDPMLAAAVETKPGLETFVQLRTRKDHF